MELLDIDYSLDEEVACITKNDACGGDAIQVFRSVKCECCKEMTSENMIRLQNGKKICLDCFTPYSRFL